jgi:hypothetical protein
MARILDIAKLNLGLSDVSDTSFDQELLTAAIGAIAVLLQLGVTEFSEVSFGVDASIPEFSDPLKKALIFAYLPAKVKLSFDPPKMGHHLNALSSHVDNLENRIAVEFSTTVLPITTPNLEVTDEILV